MFAPNRNRFNLFQFDDSPSQSELNQRTKAFFSKHVDYSALTKHKAEQADLKKKHRKVFELSLVASLVILVGCVQIMRQFSLTAPASENVDIQIEVADIPQTQQIRRPPPPARPSVPIPTEEESVPEDLTIASTDIDLTEIPPPPGPPDEGDLAIFVAYDEPPKIVGGMSALQQHLKYPRLAQRSGVEGIVFVKVLVGVDGRTERTEVIKSRPKDMGFEESATEALQKVRWEPAKQRDRKIRVWVSIPVQFRLAS